MSRRTTTQMKQKISLTKDGSCSIGIMLTIDSPQVAELLSLCGFDWLLIDMEHTAISYGGAQRMIQAVGRRVPVLVRVAENRAGAITKALDIGSQGVVVPMVNTAEQAGLAVSAAKYPPQGKRGAGIARAQGYGLETTAYIATANEAVTVIAMVEHSEAVHNIESILDVNGIDGILVGPYDLSGSFGTLGEISSDAVQGAIQTTKLACAKRSIPFGMFAADTNARSAALDGCQFALLASDALVLGRAAQEITGGAR